MRIIALVVAFFGCAQQQQGKRAPTMDTHCNDRAKPRAFEYDTKLAEQPNCGTVRVHRQVERNGQMVDDEVWLVCCR